MPYPFDYTNLAGGTSRPPGSSLSNQPPVRRQPGWSPMPRPPQTDAGVLLGGQAAGFGERYGQPLPPVGEAQRRNPYVGDGTMSTGERGGQANASPPIPQVTTPEGYGARPGGGVVADGTPPGLVYLKRIGRMMTAALAKNAIAGMMDARWRVGGVSYPPDFGFGPGYHGDAETVYPNNPQVYLRNPGIIPLTNVPVTWRYAPTGGIQAVGPSIADVGNMRPAATSS